MKNYFNVVMLVLSAAVSCAYAQTPVVAADYEYKVKQGDTLSKLSQEVLDSPKRWSDVVKYNKLPNQHLIHPGEVLRVQIAWLKNYPAAARIEAVSGAVTLNGKPANIGDAVPSGTVVKTSRGAFARVSLPDGSMVNVLENTNIEAAKIERKKQGNFFSSLFRLVSGRIDAIKVKHDEGHAPLLIKGRNATIGVRGTHFRFGQEGNNTLAEIENGLVTFGAEKTGPELAIAGGYGSVADGVSAPVLIPLLPAPKYPALPAEFTRAIQRINMPQLAGAVGFRGEVAKDAEFEQMIAPVSGQGHAVKISGLGSGSYWLRLRGVDKHGLQGMESKIEFVIKVRPFTVVPVAPEFESDKMLTRWHGEAGAQYEFQIASGNDFSYPLVSIVTRETHLDLPRPDAGQYFMRLRPTDSEGEQGGWSEPLAFTVP